MKLWELLLHLWNHSFWVRCEECGAHNATRARQLTQYQEDERNWATLCPRCQEANTKYWQEQWKEYYGSVL